ncbi:MAG: SMC-Scp complex subunit ScpB [Verrucomicrobiales bacterium]
MTFEHILESLLFATSRPLQLIDFQNALKSAAELMPEDMAAQEFSRHSEAEIQDGLARLQSKYDEDRRSFRLLEVAEGWQLVSDPVFAPWIRSLYPSNKPTRLTPAALETLAIVAYRQPITKADIEAVRGVAVDGVMQSLLERELIESHGRADLPGRPALYGTTSTFLEHFGLRALDELPNAEELRTVRLPISEPAPLDESESEPGQAQDTLPFEETNSPAP